jgi:fibronectin type 3 domain-containing protein
MTIVSGALPAGVAATASATTTALDLSGTPTTAATYSFTVKVTGCGGYSSQVSYKVVIQAGANHIVDLSWKASTSTRVVGYNVYRSPDASTWIKINPSLVASTLYTDSAVSNGSTYYYAATAVDAAGQESVKRASAKAVVP